jgi:hypothetical protein
MEMEVHLKRSQEGMWLRICLENDNRQIRLSKPPE